MCGGCLVRRIYVEHMCMSGLKLYFTYAKNKINYVCPRVLSSDSMAYCFASFKRWRPNPAQNTSSTDSTPRSSCPIPPSPCLRRPTTRTAPQSRPKKGKTPIKADRCPTTSPLAPNRLRCPRRPTSHARGVGAPAGVPGVAPPPGVSLSAALIPPSSLLLRPPTAKSPAASLMHSLTLYTPPTTCLPPRGNPNRPWRTCERSRHTHRGHWHASRPGDKIPTRGQREAMTDARRITRELSPRRQATSGGGYVAKPRFLAAEKSTLAGRAAGMGGRVRAAPCGST